ncbi:hypothetical protein Pmani_029780 [Petrolisthes manimaculis]|uniref:Uncharacterized protein n=1 Tax=Petrolisthes manimaculis TaxID=1843537 RepID=A0AAE1TTI7_9EUCA|nr:hypothetical protein Pmani_029780 [Petrolisthes manimaculis]
MVHICGRTTGVRALIPPIVGGPPLLPPPPQVEESKMTARAVLQCRPNSHPFPDHNDSSVQLCTRPLSTTTQQQYRSN